MAALIFPALPAVVSKVGISRRLPPNIAFSQGDIPKFQSQVWQCVWLRFFSCKMLA